MRRAEYWVTIHAPSALGDVVADCLLGMEVGGFTSFALSRHYIGQHHLSLAEQVLGRQRYIGMQISLDSDGVAALLNLLKSEFAGSGVEYWVTPIIQYGRV